MRQYRTPGDGLRRELGLPEITVVVLVCSDRWNLRKLEEYSGIP